MATPSTSARNCRKPFSSRSRARQSNPPAQYSSSALRDPRSVPCSQGAPGAAGGQRVLRIRSRRSDSVSSGMRIVNGSARREGAISGHPRESAAASASGPSSTPASSRRKTSCGRAAIAFMSRIVAVVWTRVMTVARALISVSDKTSVVEFARGLSSLGIEILSTGGTASLLAKEGVNVTQVQDFTGAPEMLGGRVKTLHPKVHGGILARRKLAVVQADMQKQGIQPIDLVVDTADYGVVLAELQQRREVHESTRRRLQARAYAHTAAYDAAISGWLAEQLARAHPEEGGGFAESPPLPEYRRRQSLRYGENPHQRAAFYAATPQPSEPTLAAARQIQGKELSYNNILDGAAALEAVKEHAQGRSGPAAAVIVKHTNPCGAARAATALEAYRMARDADPVSAFGGIVAITHPVDAAAGAALAETFLEAVIAPSFDKGAMEALKGKKSLRLLELPALGEGPE